MKKVIFSIFGLFILFSCTKEIEWKSFETLATLVDDGIEANKPSLVYLYSPECTLCELLDYKIFANSQVVDYLNAKFLCYKIDMTNNLLFNRILYFYGSPILLIVENEKIKSIISHADDSDRFLFAAENYKMVPLELTLAPYTHLEGEDKLIAKSVNDIFSTLYHLEKGDLKEDVLKSNLEHSVENYSCFYSRFLLSQMYGKYELEKQQRLQDSLVANITALDMMLYGSEIQSLLNKRFHINGRSLADIKFEHLLYDFGEVRQNKTYVHKFPFKNISHVPLLIYTVNASCGCTVPVWRQSPVLAGATDTITVNFTASSLGKNTKSINVITNGKRRNTVLTITAQVK